MKIKIDHGNINQEVLHETFTTDVLQIKIEADNSGLGGGDNLYFILKDGDLKKSEPSPIYYGK